MDTSSALQILSACFSTLTTWLDTRAHILARPLSIIGITLSFWIFYPKGLYSKCCVLNVAYIVMNSYGWYKWAYGGENKTQIKISRASSELCLLSVLFIIIGTVILGKIFTYMPGVKYVYADNLHTMLSLTALYFLINKKLENWIIWIVSDLVAIVICFYSELYIYVFLKICYVYLCIYGYRKWHKDYTANL